MKKLINLLNEKTLELINMKKNINEYRILKEEISVLQKTIDVNGNIELIEVIKHFDYFKSYDWSNIHKLPKNEIIITELPDYFDAIQKISPIKIREELEKRSNKNDEHIHDKTKKQEKAEEIAKKYVYGNHDALTDNQEIIDMSKDIIEFAEHIKNKPKKVYLVINEQTMIIHGCFDTMKKAVNFTKGSGTIFNIKKLYVE